jgi:hypothetical protein
VLVANVIGSNYPIACTTLTSGYQFFCMIADPASYLDVFAFNVSSNNSISGVYEYCLPSQSSENCASDLVYTPDGVVTGLVNPSANSLSLNNENPFSIRTEKHQSKLIQVSEIESVAPQKVFSLKQVESVEEIATKLKSIAGSR